MYGMNFFLGLNALNFAEADAPFGRLSKTKRAEMYFTMGLCCHSTFPYVSSLPKVRNDDMPLELLFNPGLLAFSPVVLLLPASCDKFQSLLLASQVGSDSTRQSFPHELQVVGGSGRQS